MGAAKNKADVTDPADLAFGADTLTHLNTFLPQFAQEMQERGAALSAQAAATAVVNPARKALDMHIRHFIAVFNMGVDRGRYPATDRAHYQLPVDYNNLPDLGTDGKKLLWGSNIVSGDTARVNAGGQPMENPTAAEVNTAMGNLTAALAAQSPAKDAYDKEQEDVENLRAEADELIADIWDEVLFTFRKDEAPSMRRKAREYGVVYRLDKNEEPSPDEFSVQGNVTGLQADGTSVPLADVEVTVLETDTSVLTDDEGSYLVPYQAAGNYNIRFAKDGYTEQTLPITVVDGQIAELDVVMGRDTPPSPPGP
jgi:hypothetical protein